MVVFVNFFLPSPFPLHNTHTHTHTLTPLRIMQSGSFKDTRDICTLTLLHKWAFQVALVAKNPLQVKNSCQCRRHKRNRFDLWVGKIPLEEEMATPSSILAWTIPRTEEPGGWQSMGSQRVRHDWVTEHTYCTEGPSFEFYRRDLKKNEPVSKSQNQSIGFYMHYCTYFFANLNEKPIKSYTFKIVDSKPGRIHRQLAGLSSVLSFSLFWRQCYCLWELSFRRLKLRLSRFFLKVNIFFEILPSASAVLFTGVFFHFIKLEI